MRSRTTACVVLLWVAFWFSLGMSFQDLDSGLVKTKTGWQFEDDIEFLDGVAPAPAKTLTKDHMELFNSDFELSKITGTATVLATVNDTTMIPNWLPGQNGVQILQASTYQMSSFAPGALAIHLNNPSANGTQGSISSLNFTWNPHPATLYTVQYDCARHPDGPLNLQSALKISAMSGITVTYYTLHKPRYNATDSPKQITWVRQSFLFMGTGAPTSLKFESMSEKFGPIVDNVALLHGVHILHTNSAPIPASIVPLWQRMCCHLFTVVALMATEHSEALLFLTEAAVYWNTELTLGILLYSTRLVQLFHARWTRLCEDTAVL